MGLDNGLTIEPKTAKAKKFMKKNFKHLKNTFEENTYEVLYARKCWNIRHRFLDYGFLRDANLDGEKRIYIEDIPTIIDKILKYFLEEDNWREDGDSIWDWHIMLPHIANAISNLRKFLDYLENDDEEYSEDDFFISFYDSY